MKETKCISCEVLLRLRNVEGVPNNPVKHTCKKPINVLKMYGYKMGVGLDFEGNPQRVLVAPRAFKIVFGGKFKRKGNLKEYLELIQDDIAAWEAWLKELTKMEVKGPCKFYFHTVHDGTKYYFDTLKGRQKINAFKDVLQNEFSKVKAGKNTPAYHTYNGLYRIRVQSPTLSERFKMLFGWKPKAGYDHEKIKQWLADGAFKL